MENIPEAQPSLEEQLAGLELQPQLFNPEVNKEELHHIDRNLREQISKSVREMKAQARIAEETSESNYALAIVPFSAVVPQEAPKKKGRKTTTKVVGEISVSFEVPLICILNNIDLDRLPQSGEQGNDANKNHQYLFIERLENWNIQQRERSNGMRDIYYHHERSAHSFRSITEVVNFLIFESYPPKPNGKANQEIAEAMDASATPSASLGRKKHKSYGGNDKKMKQAEKMDVTMVRNFFIESARNLMNCNFNDPDESSEEDA